MTRSSHIAPATAADALRVLQDPILRRAAFPLARDASAGFARAVTAMPPPPATP